MRIARWAWVGVLLLILASGGCRRDPGAEFAAYTSGLGLGISFGQHRIAVQGVLGAPHSSTERNGYAEDYYVSVIQGIAPDMPDPTAPQLTLTYVSDNLVGLYNHYDPTTTGSPAPPHVAEPATGARLGHRRSQFEAALGPGNFGPLRDGWRFESGDGRAVLIQAEFVEVPALGSERLCSSLSITVEDVDASRGEYYEKRRERNERIKDL